MAQEFVQINTATDVLMDERIKTYGYFSGDAGSFTGTGFITASDSAGNKEYYYTLQNSSGVDQLSVAYGHIEGSGSSDAATAGNPGQSEAIYKSIANRVLDYDEARVGFCFTASQYHSPTNRKKDIYVIAAQRSRMRDELDRRYWTIQLSGSKADGTGSMLHLTDNSAASAGEPTMAGTRFNIISGSQGVPTPAGTTTVFGHYYPKSGLIILDANQVSASLPGAHNAKLSGGNHVWQTFDDANLGGGSGLANARGFGLAPNLGTTGNENNALRLAAALGRGTQTLRAKEKFLQQNYLCRAGAGNFNYTNNTSYTTGSNYDWTVPTWQSDPHTYISRVGLYDSGQHLVAVGTLSTPLLKNQFTELIFKLRLTY